MAPKLKGRAAGRPKSLAKPAVGASSSSSTTGPSPSKVGRSGLGNLAADAKSSELSTMREWIWEAINKDAGEELVLPTYMFIMKRKRGSEEVADESFLTTTPQISFATLAKMPEPVAIDWLAQRSDLSERQIVAMIKVDSTALQTLLHAALQMSTKQTFPSCLRYEPVFVKFMASRSSAVGFRLEQFVNKGGVSADGKINLEVAGMYAIIFEENSDLIKELKHFSGDIVAVPRAAKLNAGYKLLDAHCDWGARLSLPMMPEVYLHQFFVADKSGPYRYTKYISKPTQVETDAQAIYDQWVTDEKARLGNANEPKALASELVGDLERHKKKQKQDMAKKAREMALAAIAKKNDNLAVTLVAPTVASGSQLQ